MMDFFRKYQRYFLIAVTAIMIFSFVFFGTFSTFVNEPEVKDKLIAQAIDGSKLMQSEVQKLARFIATDRQDAPSRNSSLPNFCNDGVIRFDLLQTGLADLLVSNYFDSMQETLRHRLERVKRFRPYAHPDAPFLSAAAVWDRFIPGFNQEIAALQAESEISSKTFGQLSHLYEQESRCPSEWVRKILLFQRQQYSWLRPDPRLEQEDLALFGFHTVADWFGNDFIDLCAEFILNAARAAEQKGYKVSLEEAKADLIKHYSFTVQKIREAKQDKALGDLNFHTHLRMLGFDEKSAAAVWRNVLLFRRYFQGVGQAAFIDRLPFSDFASFALESAIVQLYEWPNALRLKSFSDLIQFQYYVKAVAKEHDLLTLPSEILSFDEIEKSHPELIQTSYSAQVAKISKDEIGLRASVKEVWDWQLENWDTLRSKFSFISTASTRDERFKVLEALPITQRSQIDAYTRNTLVDAHPEWVENAYGKTAFNQEIQISKVHCSLSNIEKIEPFTVSLETASLTGMPFRYSDDGITFYQISDVKKTKERQLLTFESAKSQGILQSQVQKLLEAEYSNIRAKYPDRFKAEDGKCKPFSDVKDQIASILYADLLKAIDRADPKEWEAGKGPLESYAYRRLVANTKDSLLHLQQNQADPHWIQTGKDPLTEQFKLQKKEHQIQRIAKEKWMKEEAFQMLPNQWSSIHIAPDGEIAFFYFQEKKPHPAPILEQLVMGKETIAADAQRFLAERLLSEAKRKKSIVIPIQGKNHESI